MRTITRFLLIAAILLAGGASAHAAPNAVHLERITQLPGGTLADAGSAFASVTPGGRYVVFCTFAANLVPGDTEAVPDIYLYDRDLLAFERIAPVADPGEVSYCAMSSIFADGRYVAFHSQAATLVPAGDNGLEHVYVYDRLAGVVERISRNAAGQAGDGASGPPTISADGRFVAYTSDASNLVPHDTNGRSDVFVFDRQTGQTRRVSVAGNGSQADGLSALGVISADGRVVAFRSDAANLVPGDTNGVDDIFVHDLQTGQTRRVSVAGDGSQADARSDYPAISAGGRFVTFASQATNLAAPVESGDQRIYLHDLEAGLTELVSVASGEINPLWINFSTFSSVSADGRYVVFDTGGQQQVYLRDRLAATTELVSTSDAGDFGEGYSCLPYISPDGGLIAFSSSDWILAPGGDPDPDRDYTHIYLSDRGLPAAGPAVEIPAGASASETAGALAFEVSLSAPAADAVAVQYATAALSAGAADYEPVSSELTFAPGVMHRTVTIQLTPDGLAEGDEAFRIVFSDPVNARLGPSAAVVCTILDTWRTKIFFPAIVGP